MIHSGSKQALVHYMVKGEDKYLRTMASILRFLQDHNLRGKNITIPKKDPTKNSFKADLAFTNMGEGSDAPRDVAGKKTKKLNPTSSAVSVGSSVMSYSHTKKAYLEGVPYKQVRY